MTDKAYPEMPLADYWGSQASPEDLPLFTADQMRAYVDADRARGDEQRHFICLCPDCTRPRNAAGSGISDADIAALRDKHGITSSGRGIRAFEQVRNFVHAVLAMAPATTQPSPERDVTKIMLGITPGPDGMGHEVYAESVADVEAVLSRMGQELEEWQLGIRRLEPATTQAQEAGSGSDDNTAAWAERHGAQVAWANDPDMHHIIKMTPPELRAMLAFASAQADSAPGDEAQVLAFSVQEIADACQYAEIGDGQFESVLIALHDNRRAARAAMGGEKS